MNSVSRLTIPLTLAGSLLLSTLGALSVWTGFKEETRLRIQRLEDAFLNQNEMVKEIRSDVKELKRR